MKLSDVPARTVISIALVYVVGLAQSATTISPESFDGKKKKRTSLDKKL